MTCTLLFQEKIREFSKDRILTRPDLGEQNRFPEDIWEAMGAQGVLDPWALGGAKEDSVEKSGFCGSVAAAALDLTACGGCMGLTLSWIIHHMVARHLVFSPLGGIVDSGLKSRVRKGQTTICFAVSEPDAGAHPKYLKTTARKEENGFILNGRKAFLTNGPIAGFFLVVAITGQDQGKNRFSAFLVARDTPGLTVGDPMKIPFFKPCPHGELVLDACRVGRDALVGPEDQAWPSMVLPFRALEDAVMTGAVAGAMTLMLEHLVANLRKAASSPDREALQALGGLKAQMDAAVFLSGTIAHMADPPKLPEHSILESLIMQFRQNLSLFLDGVDAFCLKNSCPLTPPACILAQDLRRSAGISQRTRQAKQQKIGARMLDTAS